MGRRCILCFSAAITSSQRLPPQDLPARQRLLIQKAGYCHCGHSVSDIFVPVQPILTDIQPILNYFQLINGSSYSIAKPLGLGFRVYKGVPSVPCTKCTNFLVQNVETGNSWIPSFCILYKDSAAGLLLGCLAACFWAAPGCFWAASGLLLACSWACSWAAWLLLVLAAAGWGPCVKCRN